MSLLAAGKISFYTQLGTVLHKNSGPASLPCFILKILISTKSRESILSTPSGDVMFSAAHSSDWGGLGPKAEHTHQLTILTGTVSSLFHWILQAKVLGNLQRLWPDSYSFESRTRAVSAKPNCVSSLICQKPTLLSGFSSYVIWSASD